jgi:hypothetical protein
MLTRVLVHKQQRSRQLNEGTFESRMHQGFDGAKTKEDQGELFGSQNIFRFDPKGFVQGNVSDFYAARLKRFADSSVAGKSSSSGRSIRPGPHRGRIQRR